MTGLRGALRQVPGLGLVLLMLGIAALGIVAGLVRAAWLDEAGWRLLIYAPWLLLPVVVAGMLCLWLFRTQRRAALWGGLSAALVAVGSSFEMLHPRYNEDANIGLGLYVLFGWLFPLGPALLVGGLLGSLAERYVSSRP